MRLPRDRSCYPLPRPQTTPVIQIKQKGAHATQPRRPPMQAPAVGCAVASSSSCPLMARRWRLLPFAILHLRECCIITRSGCRCCSTSRWSILSHRGRRGFPGNAQVASGQLPGNPGDLKSINFSPLKPGAIWSAPGGHVGPTWRPEAPRRPPGAQLVPSWIVREDCLALLLMRFRSSSFLTRPQYGSVACVLALARCFWKAPTPLF